MTSGKKNIELTTALQSDEASIRLRAALIAGSNPDVGFLDALIERCSVESDFNVREQLTWSLTRFPKEIVVPKLMAEVSSGSNQARSQALHTLSKIKDAKAWTVITEALLQDPSDEVAQAAWRAAISLVPSGAEMRLAENLGLQFGRGGREVQLSLSSALVALGGVAAEPVIVKAISSNDRNVKMHALVTQKLLVDSDTNFQYAVDQVKVLLAPRPKD